MSDEATASGDVTHDNGMSELEMLKARATMMGVEFSNNIGLETLRKRVHEAMDKDDQAGPDVNDPNATTDENVADVKLFQTPAPQPALQPNGLEAAAAVGLAKTSVADENTPMAEPAQPKSPRQKMLEEEMRLIRCRITNLDPKKATLHGEVLTVANEFLGTVRKFIPFGEVTDDGFHVPYILFKQLESRKFLHIQVGKDKRTGTPTVKTVWAKEFAIEVLDPLTPEELRRLAIAQTAAGSVDSASD